MNTKYAVIVSLTLILVLSACSTAATEAPTYAAPATRTNHYSPEPTRAPSIASALNPLPTQALAATMPDISGNPPLDNTFQGYGVNTYMDTREDHLSTFGLDVDTASYTVMRRYLNDGNLPPADSVRVEEYVNYFDMDYPSPPEVAFAVYADGAPSPFTYDGTQILRIGIQGYQVPDQNRKPSNLVFVIDTSGSMQQENRIDLVKRSLELVLEQMRPSDSVGIVIFGTDARVMLEPMSGLHQNEILSAISSISTGGTTNVQAGLNIGYQMAMQYYKPGGNNRVILCSDGVANTGAVSANEILDGIHGYVSEGITLTTAGFGMGNFNDTLMENMADKGNGSYFYIDNLDEATNVFVKDLTSTLQVIAKDAKVQVDFNPDIVNSYRLLGYENRAIADQDFRNDSVDAGEIGAGHSVTALYAVRLVPNAQGRIATVQLRWQDPDSNDIREINGNINTFDLAASFDQADAHYQLAVLVAQFAEVLRNSPYADRNSLPMLREQTYRLTEYLPGDPDVTEFANLVDRAIHNSR